MNCVKCGDSDVIIESLCAECLNEREYERIEKQEQARNRRHGWDEDDWD